LTLFAYIAAIFVGILLGLLGGGGSILSVPVLRYLFDYSAETATGYSLFIVGVSGIVGTLLYAREKLIHTQALFTFGVVASSVSFLNRKYVVSNIPKDLFTLGNTIITKDFFIMIVFAVLMLAAAAAMIRNQKEEKQERKVSVFQFLVAGWLVGVFTSLVGAGGGFIIVPVLVGMYQMPIKMAIGTSLSIIVLNSLAGFAGELSTGSNIEWPFLWVFSGISTIGVLIGMYASKRIDAKRLKPLFGWFIIAVSIYIVTKELIEIR
jgi:uncharacterized protein